MTKRQRIFGFFTFVTVGWGLLVVVARSLEPTITSRAGFWLAVVAELVVVWTFAYFTTRSHRLAR